VTQIVPQENAIVVGSKEETKTRVLRVDRINWFANHDGKKTLRVQAKIRSRHAKAWAKLERCHTGDAIVIFDEPQEAVTPGQACVFYEGSRVLGGGWITSGVEELYVQKF
jgi:tRNA-specific 2-thiouridylase